MARSTTSAGGYTLIEFALVLALTALLAAGAYPQLRERLEARALRYTWLGFNQLATLALRHRSISGEQWPNAPRDLAPLIDAPEDWQARNNFGGAYQFEIENDQLRISTDMGDARLATRMRHMLGPLAAVEGSEVGVWLPTPGEEISRAFFISGNRDDLPMFAPLNMDSHGLIHLGGINSRRAGVYDLSTAQHDGVVHVQTVIARRIFADNWQGRIRHGAPNLDINDDQYKFAAP